MASTSSIQKSFKYDVFLSFRGEDTRNSFIGHLYQALKQKGIETYMDDKKIKQGKTIKDQLIKSIEDSRVYIIVFSKTYASSSWCLDELVKIIECQKTAEQTAYPVFFDVEPTQVCKQSGPVKEAFAKHEEKEAAGKWREAMKEASGLAGWELKKIASGDESKLIQIIVDKIFRKLCSISLSIDGNLIGMEMRKKEVLSSLDIGTNDVRVIGIKGIGGGGKTTLARAVYDQISTHFDGKSFVENVREVSKTPFSGLKTLQEQILRDVFDDRNISISGVSDGKKIMIKMMRRQKVLVVLDDVDHRKQLEALVDNFDNFKPGSRIIITTRDEHVLLSFGVCLICNVNLLTDEEAVCLFRRYAFGKEIPNQGFNEMSGQVVRYAAGLPLTIKVLGSSLRGKSKLEWEDALKRLKKVPENKTQEMLKISYDALEDDYKEIFLDVACILKGEQKDKAIRVLESCGFYGTIGLSVLEQKCLINISQSGSLGMHDLIEEMGKHIVRRSDPNEPNRDSRLWIEENTEDRLDNDLVNERIRCIKLSQSELEFDTVMRGLRNTRKLRVLYMCSGANWNDSKVRQCFPDSLQYLSWRSYPFLCLHETFQADNLVGLDMSFSSIVQIWEWGKRKVLNKLRFLDLSYSNLTTLNLEVTPKLEILNLEHCADLEELYIPYECPKLQYLNLDFSNLRNLSLGPTPDLETLSLGGCSNLLQLHMSRCPKLKVPKLDGSDMRTLELGLTLSIEGCNLAELHMPSEYPKLKFISFHNSKLRKLNLGLTPDLETLRLGGCCNLILLHMPFQCLKLNSLSLANSKLRTLDLRLTPNLERLDLKDCSKLEKIDAPDGCLEKLVYLDISGCGRFKSFLFDKQSKPLKVGSLSELHLIGESIDICPLHPDNSFPKFQFTCFYQEDPAASSFGNLEKLISIGLCSCTNLGSFSRSIYSLQCLEKLTLEGSIPEVYKDFQQLLKGFPVSIFELKRLKYIHLLNCTPDDLPEELGHLNLLRHGITLNFKMLKLEGCNDLVDLHLQVETLNHKYLELNNSNLKTLKLGNTPNLEKLILKGCNDLVELQMNTPNLKKLILKGCYHLVELQMPEESLNLKYLELLRSKLKTIQLGNTPNLEELILEYCTDLVELQMPDESLNLKYLNLSRSKLKTIQLGNTPNLEKLILRGCYDLVEFQKPDESLNLKYLELRRSKLKTIQLGNTPNLEELILEDCKDLVELQMPDESLNLKYLNLSHSKLKTIQLGNTPNLKFLDLKGCKDLVELQMPNESLNLKFLDLSESKLKTVHLGNTPNLEKLFLIGCNDLIELQMPAESLKLAVLDGSRSSLTKLLHLVNTPNLKELILIGCYDLVEFQMPAQSCFRLNLENLNLSRSKMKTVQLRNTPNLKALKLRMCEDLVELQMPDESLNLEYLDVSYSRLKTVHLGNTPNLKVLRLESCLHLVEFQMPVRLNLEKLDLSRSKMKFVHLGNTPNLKELDLRCCYDLIEFQMPDESLNLEYLNLSHSKLKTVHLGNTPNLKALTLEGCDYLVEFQMPAESFRLNLKDLNLSHSKLKTIQLGNIPNLEKLTLKGCNDLVELQMPKESLNLKYLDLSHSKLKILDLGLTPNLEWLDLKDCSNLEKIDASDGCLQKLVYLYLSGCGRFKSFWFDMRPHFYHSKKQLDSLSELHLIAETIDVCQLHPDNSFPKFRFKCYYDEDRFSSFGNLEMLISMGLCACTNLENFSRSICSLRGLRKLTLGGSIPEVPRDLDQLECLEELIFSSSNIINLPDSICKLKHLKSLKLKSCLLLEKLPDDLGRIESLETLTITDCSRLRDIPNNIGKIKCVVSPNVYKRYTHGKFKKQPK